MSIRKNKLISDDLEEVKSFFSIPRFQLVSTLDLSRCWRLKTVRLIYLLHYSLKSNMRELQLRQLDMSGIPRDLLGEAVSRSRLASLSMCENLRPTRITAVFTHTSRSKTLEELDFERVDLSSVPAPLLVGTVVRLRKVNLSSTSLTAPQASALLTGVLSSSSLEDLDLAGVDLRHMPPDLLAHAVSRLRRVCLWHTYLTTQQITAILKRCRLSTSLDFLDLSTNNISSVPPKLLAKSLTRIRSVKLMGIGQPAGGGCGQAEDSGALDDQPCGETADESAEEFPDISQSKDTSPVLGHSGCQRGVAGKSKDENQYQGTKAGLPEKFEVM